MDNKIDLKNKWLILKVALEINKELYEENKIGYKMYKYALDKLMAKLNYI